MSGRTYMIPARLVLLSAATWLLFVSSAYGYISDPTLSGLVEGADVIVVGATDSVRTPLRFLVPLVVVAVLHWRLLSGRFAAA